MDTISRPPRHASKSNWQTYYSRLRDAGRLAGTIADALRKRDARPAHAPEAPRTLRERLAARKVKVRLDQETRETYERAAAEQNRRRRNWDEVEATTDPAVSLTVREINHGRYSSRCTYNRYTYRPIVHCAALILSPREISFRIENRRKRIKAPRGYRWTVSNGFLAIAPNADPGLTYATAAVDLYDYNPRDLIADWRAAHADLFRQQAARREQRQAERQRRAVLAGKRQLTTETETATETAPQPSPRQIVTIESEGNHATML